MRKVIKTKTNELQFWASNNGGCLFLETRSQILDRGIKLTKSGTPILVNPLTFDKECRQYAERFYN